MSRYQLQSMTLSMNAIRVARAAVRMRPTAVWSSTQRRGYADAIADKIKLTLALPHQVAKLPFSPDTEADPILCSQSTSLQMCKIPPL